MAREMKDSGTWAHKIPLKWKIMNFSLATQKITTGLNPRNNFKLNDSSAKNYYVTIRNFKNGKLFLDDNCDKITDDALSLIQKRSNLKKNDILFASISKEGQAYLISNNPQNWNINESVFSIRVNETFFCAKYFYYQITNPAYYESLKIDATGSTFKSIKQDKLKQSTVVRPPLSEQQKIADFLDEKVKEIDNAIEKTKETIELYKKYKQAIITETVTKGLDPNTKMKDSGIEWIGKIPSHWEVLRIKHVCANRIEKALYNHKTDKYLGLENVIGFSNKIIITDSTYDDGYYDIYKTGDVLFNKLRPYLGKVIIAEDNGFCTGEFMRLYNFNGSNQFLRYWMINSFFLNEVNNSTYGAKMPRANPDFILNMPIYMPPFEEQIRIASFLNQKSFEIDKILVTKNNFINRLNILKKSLIYEYVTGKKEVK